MLAVRGEQVRSWGCSQGASQVVGLAVRGEQVRSWGCSQGASQVVGLGVREPVR